MFTLNLMAGFCFKVKYSFSALSNEISMCLKAFQVISRDVIIGFSERVFGLAFEEYFFWFRLYFYLLYFSV